MRLGDGALQAPIAFHELEWRSDALGASAGRVISKCHQPLQIGNRALLCYNRAAFCQGIDAGPCARFCAKVVPPFVLTPEGSAFDHLDSGRHSHKSFFGEKPPLDAFLRALASPARTKNLSTSHVLIRTEAIGSGPFPIAGSDTLVSSEIAVSESSSEFEKLTKKDRVPLSLLARMATDIPQAGKRIGECLLKFTLAEAWEMKLATGWSRSWWMLKMTTQGVFIRSGLHSAPTDRCAFTCR